MVQAAEPNLDFTIPFHDDNTQSSAADNSAAEAIVTQKISKK